MKIISRPNLLSIIATLSALLNISVIIFYYYHNGWFLSSPEIKKVILYIAWPGFFLTVIASWIWVKEAGSSFFRLVTLWFAFGGVGVSIALGGILYIGNELSQEVNPGMIFFIVSCILYFFLFIDIFLWFMEEAKKMKAE